MLRPSCRLVLTVLAGLSAISISAQGAPRSRRQPQSGCKNPCRNRVLGDKPYLYTLTGDGTTYAWPAEKEPNGWNVRASALQFREQPFTLPFSDRDIKSFNGWLYSNHNYHYAFDYADGAYRGTFEVRAAAAGRVLFVGWDNWSGNTIVLSHDAGGVKDSFRTIYMHLRNGPANDCENAWSKSMPSLDEPSLSKYRRHLIASGCVREDGRRKLDPLHWGTPDQRIEVSVGTLVRAGDVIAHAGDTGPGGQIADANPNHPNTHLHVFFAHRDPSNERWYFFDPYGAYGARACYPQGLTDRIDADCARYSIAWKDGRPQRP